jgi:hypothetical protein
VNAAPDGGRPTGRRADRSKVSLLRVAIWAVTAAVGAYLVLTGVLGIVAKG